MLFDAPKLCSLAARLDRERCSSMPPMTRANPVERRLLSYGQRRLWFLHEMDPTSYAYILYGVLHIQGALDVAALEDALSGVVARHESLRTIFVSEAGEPKQIALDASPIDLRRVRAQTESLIEEATRVTHDMVLRPWNLAEGPLLRFTLVDSSPSEHVLIVAMHHIVADGWSIGVLLRDLAALYDARVAGVAPALDDLPLQYADFAARQNDPSLAGEREDALAYWRRQLEGAPQRLDLTPLSCGPHTSQRGAQRKFSLTRELTQALKSLGRERGTTLYMTLLAAFQILISRSTGQADFLVGSPVAGRNRIELHGLVGFFVNTLILRADLSGDPTFREVLARVRRTVLEALAHQELPVERSVAAVQPDREASMTPLFQ